MRQLIEQLFSGDEQLELCLGVMETVDGIIKRQPEDAWLQVIQGKHEIVQQVQQDLIGSGLMGLGVAEEHGGLGKGLLGPVLMLDMLAQAGLATFESLLTHFSRYPVVTHGTPAQIEKYVLPTITDGAVFCILATEPNAGTNTFRVSSKAIKRGDKWILNGQKTFITGAGDADFGFLICKTEDESPGSLSVFALDMKSHGIEMQKMNINAFPNETQYNVFFDDVEMPEDALIGREGTGGMVMFAGLNAERFVVSTAGLGTADLALKAAVNHVSQRQLFGKRVTGSYQAIQHPLAQHKAETDAARLMMYYGVKKFDSGVDAGAEANMVKLLSSQAAARMCNAAIQSHGGSGMDEDTGMLALWRIARTLEIAPLNNEMILNFIAEHVIGLPKSY